MWYPEVEIPDSDGDDDDWTNWNDPGITHLYGDDDDGPSRYGPDGYVEVVYPSAGIKITTDNTHKRAISDAIPATERPNNKEQVDLDHSNQGGTRGDDETEAARRDGDGNDDGTGNSLRRSVRTRKATRKANGNN